MSDLFSAMSHSCGLHKGVSPCSCGMSTEPRARTRQRDFLGGSASSDGRSALHSGALCYGMSPDTSRSDDEWGGSPPPGQKRLLRAGVASEPGPSHPFSEAKALCSESLSALPPPLPRLSLGVSCRRRHS